jgi:hypothetical protein
VVESLRARIETIDRGRSSDGRHEDATRRATSNLVSVKGLTGTGAVTAHLDNLVVSVKGLAGTGAVTARHDSALLGSRSTQPHARDSGADANDTSAAGAPTSESRREPTTAIDLTPDLMSEVARRVEAVKAQLRAEMKASETRHAAELKASETRHTAVVTELRQLIVDLATDLKILRRDRR